MLQRLSPFSLEVKGDSTGQVRQTEDLRILDSQRQIHSLACDAGGSFNLPPASIAAERDLQRQCARHAERLSRR